MIKTVNYPMAMPIHNHFHHLHFSDYTSHDGCLPRNWNYCSPVADWEAFSGTDSHGDFHDLIDSMMNVDAPPYAAEVDGGSDCNPGSTTEEEELAEAEDQEEELQGLRLYHLLMAAADALYGEHKSRDLAHVILVRLNELVSPSHGTNLERLAAYYTQALQGLLECTAGAGKSHYHLHRDDHSPSDVLAAFQLLQEMSPYVKFGHFTANQAILEAVGDDRRVHIVDYDIMEGIQWASLMQAFVSRKDGPPAPHLRITAISRCGTTTRRSIGTVQETGRRLVAFAASVGQPFSFHQCKLESDESFRVAGLKLVRGEAVVVNCMLHLPHFRYRTPESIGSFLRGAKALNPRVVCLVEEEIGHGIGGSGEGDYKVEFVESLERYSAIYESLEAGFPMKNRGRALVERVFLGPRIWGSVGRMGQPWRAEGSWGERLGKMGLKAAPISFANHCQARLLVGLFNDGYTVEELSNNKLVLGWKSNRLLSASIWASSYSSPPPSSSSSSDTE